MNKPERVEVGQWWVPKYAQDSPWRIEPEHLTQADPADPMDGDWSWLTDGFDYAGNGAHPEPSEWMIETLAEHAWDVLFKAESVHDYADPTPRPWCDESNAMKERERWYARQILAGEQLFLSAGEWGIRLGAVTSIYRILRSLGKW